MSVSKKKDPPRTSWEPSVNGDEIDVGPDPDNDGWVALKINGEVASLTKRETRELAAGLLYTLSQLDQLEGRGNK